MTPDEVRAFVDRHYEGLRQCAVDAPVPMAVSGWAAYISFQLRVSLTPDDTWEVLREYNRRHERQGRRDATEIDH